MDVLRLPVQHRWRAGIEYTNKIESFTIKQGIKQLYTGAERFPQIEPTKIEFPAHHRHDLARLRRSRPRLVRRARRQGRRRSRAAEDRLDRVPVAGPHSVLFRIKLYEVGIGHAQIMQSTANADQIKRVKFELYVGRMELDGPGGLGFE